MPVIASPRSEAREALRDAGERAGWPIRLSLTPRILAVNVLAMLLLAGGFFYLDSFRSRIIDARVVQAQREAGLLAAALAAAPDDRTAQLARLARRTAARLVVFDRRNHVVADSDTQGVHSFALRDPATDPWNQAVARWLDRVIDFVVAARLAPRFDPGALAGPVTLPDVATARGGAGSSATVWRAPDRTPIITAAAALPDGAVLLSVVNARDITQTVRVERARLGVVLAVAAAISIALSLFLARTIVGPLRRLARAAVRVRLGRAREVVVPRLPERRDEIGMLARALSDMSLALRARIDATEAFAADVTHEMKNPLASLRSAVDGLTHVGDPDLRAKLLAIVHDDVRRLDRLISDISEASRLDAQLSRAKFERVDLHAMLAAMVAQHAARGDAVTFHGEEALDVAGEGARLERAFENLIGNALSFSPHDGIVAVRARRDATGIDIRVEDDGPGVPAEAREAIFRRFHSVRPDAEAFGRHSGLGLAIARTIVEGHGGQIGVGSRPDGRRGASFVVRLPAAEARA